MRPSITLRLSLFFAATSAAALLAVGAVIGQLVNQHFEELDLAELIAKAAVVQHALADIRAPEDIGRLPARLDDALVGHGFAVGVFAPDGSRIYLTGGAKLPDFLLQARPKEPEEEKWPLLGGEADGARFRGVASLLRSGLADQPPFKVVVALNLEHHAEFTTNFRHVLWASVTLGIVLTSLLGWLVARRGLAPLRHIAGVAQNISVERLHDRLALDEVPVEIADLACAFNAMLSRLEESFQRLSHFSSDIAHELRTPISNLLTQTQVAVSRARSADEYREILYSNLEEYERLTRMVADMLFIAKADNGLIIPERSEVDLAREVDELLEFYQPVAEEKQVTLARQGEAKVSGDRLMLRRAIANLLSNAIRHTPNQGEIQVSLGLDDALVSVAVTNSGEDIVPEHLPHLFERFFRADESRHRSSEGAGLGLAIVKSIVASHGGHIGASSTNGRTTFAMSIPCEARTPA